ncbi:MAG: hypothetical protein EZS28_037804 [Streblomastix strix]|uniref:Ribophorin II C-terminal domain-containing protein n=1 Tax=Streblomastix strix TaxID=222440 RepID=A0A5J4U8Z6_9EUKA|nr:MAG: hypothetical protein EZS28_037804 [Streblomastix strix]
MKAFTFSPEIEHTFELKKALPDPKISQGFSVILFIPFLIFLAIIPFIGLKVKFPRTFKGVLWCLLFITSLSASIVVLVQYWLGAFLLFPELALFSACSLCAAVFGKLYFEEQRKFI